MKQVSEEIAAPSEQLNQDSKATAAAGGRNKAESQSRKIFIGGLNYNTTEEGLKEHFGAYGEIVDVVVMKFPDTKR